MERNAVDAPLAGQSSLCSGFPRQSEKRAGLHLLVDPDWSWRLGEFFLFSFFFFSFFPFLIMVVTSWLPVGDDQVESRFWWVAGGSSHTFVAESPDECARAVMGVTSQSGLFSPFSFLSSWWCGGGVLWRVRGVCVACGVCVCVVCVLGDSNVCVVLVVCVSFGCVHENRNITWTRG